MGLLILLVLSPFTSGCVVALVPLAAGAVIGSRTVSSGDRSAEEVAAARARKKARKPVPKAADAAPGTGVAAPSIESAALPPGSVPHDFQYLFGSGEGAAISEQAYRGVIDFLRARADDRIAGYQVASVMLDPGSSLQQPRFTPCDDKPLAVVFDVDETSILNLGYEADELSRGLAYDEERWQRWEATGAGAVVAVPGAVRAVNAARKAGITVIFNSNRTSRNAAATARALEAVGFGKLEPGKTLILRDPGSSAGKDARRQSIAVRYCVVAMVGDQLGDFSDLFSATNLSIPGRRAAVSNVQFQPLWGAGWFILPNPVYGTAVKGGIDEVFPADKRWVDPAADDNNDAVTAPPSK